MEERIARTMEALRANRMEAYYVETKEEAAGQAAALRREGDVIAAGGSMTLGETGIREMLRRGPYRFLDRDRAGLSREQVEEIYRESFRADAYLCSANAVTERGELYNVDGNSNRVAAILYGPKSVIVVAGCNKIVPDLAAAVHRVKTQAAPKNCARLSCATFCREAGECVSLRQDSPEMPEGCRSEARICCNYVVSAYQRQQGRIKVILVGEPLGY